MKHAKTALALVLCLSLCACTAPAKPSGAPPSAPETVSPEAPAADSAAQEFLAAITPETAELKGVCGPNLVWYYEDNVLIVKGTGEMTSPSWRAYSITTSEQYLYDRVLWVILDEGVTSIACEAFQYFELLSIAIPSSVTEIGYEAFSSNVSIRGEAGSYAETYANEYGIPFEAE